MYYPSHTKPLLLPSSKIIWDYLLLNFSQRYIHRSQISLSKIPTSPFFLFFHQRILKSQRALPVSIYLLKISNKNTRKKCLKVNNKKKQNVVIDIILVFLLLTLPYFTPFSSVSVVDFEEVNISWAKTRKGCQITWICICHKRPMIFKKVCQGIFSSHLYPKILR